MATNSIERGGREKFKSRMGFILVSAGCAVGLGNVWKFPYITGQYGGAAFVVLYLVFLAILGIPIMVMEFSLGRGGGKGIAGFFEALEPKGSKWHAYKWFGIGGNYLLMMFYTMVAGWMLYFLYKMISGGFVGATAEVTNAAFGNLLSDPITLIFWTFVVGIIAIVICALGLNNGVERVTKVMMLILLILIVVLAVNSITLDGAEAGLAFYLKPDFGKLFSSWGNFAEAAQVAMGHSFFTLSVGIGSMAIFGSYRDKTNTLMSEGLWIGILDTCVALCAGLIIFPACSAYGVDAGAGPSLIFQTLPLVFAQMPLGRLWGSLFFVFMSFAALSTVVAVYENIVSFNMDNWGWSRKKSALVTFIAIMILSMPAALGYNVWAGVTLPGFSDIMDIEDFIVSNNLLPIGSLIFLIFCVSKKGWGWKNFLEETNTGKGLKFPKKMRLWMTYGAPILIMIILIGGWTSRFLG